MVLGYIYVSHFQPLKYDDISTLINARRARPHVSGYFSSSSLRDAIKVAVPCKKQCKNATHITHYD